MPMKNPPHPGELVRDNLQEVGVSVAEAGRALGVTRQQLYNIIKGKSSITPEMAVRFEKGFGGSAEFWLQLQQNYDLAQARRKTQGSVRRLRPRVA